jgi:pimeloyl-ACP methyl ester carboxylesterase
MLMKARGIKKFSIAGHSLGGFIGGHYLNRYPEEVKDLYLISPGGMNLFRPEYKKELEKKIEARGKKSSWWKTFFFRFAVDRVFEKKVNSLYLIINSPF